MRIDVSTHSRPKAAGINAQVRQVVSSVSTHSRPKAAGSPPMYALYQATGFNTQPPEGGWYDAILDRSPK